jgi:hypothetical protein
MMIEKRILMVVVVANRGVALEFVWKDWVKLRVTLMKMTFDPGRHSKHETTSDLNEDDL